MPTDLLKLAGYINEQGEMGRQRGQETALARLYSQGLQTPSDQRAPLLAQMAQIRPEAAMQAQQSFAQLDDRGWQEVARYAQAFDALPDDQHKAAAYPQLVERARALGLPIPQEAYKPEYGANIRRLVQQLGSAGLSAEMQTFNALTEGMAPEDVMRARRVELGLDPRAVTAAQRPVTVNIGGRDYQTTFDPQTGNYTLAGLDMGGGTPSPQPASGGLFAGLSAIPGITVTSGARTPQHNAEVGGVPNSFHLSGQARDILPPQTPQQAQAVRQWAAQNGMEVINEGDHWHIEPAGNAPRVPIVGRLPEEEAGAVETAKGRAGLNLLPEQGRIEAENARIKKQAELEAQRESDRILNMPKARSALQGAKAAGENVKRAIGQALPNINVWSAGYVGVPLSKLPGSQAADLRATLDTIEANIAFDRLQQMRQSSPTGGALGSVSERELDLLAAAIASLKQSQSPEQLRSNLEHVQRQYERVLRQMEADFQADYENPSARSVGSYSGASISPIGNDPLGIL